MKEWNGNKNSVAAMLGMRTVWHPEEREPNDFYSTDPKAVRALMNRLQVSRDTMIYECACGSGNLSKELESMGYNVLSTDLIDRGYGTSGVDFLKVQTIPDNCMILTNPPYKYTTEFIAHSMELQKEGGVAAFLLNISYLSGLARYRDIYTKGWLEKVYVFSNRVHCFKNDINTGHSSPVNYAWYIFRNGHMGSPVIEWLKV